MTRDTKRMIIEKALYLFFRKGYEGCSLTEICKSTKLTKGAVYHYFENKEALYRAAVEDLFSKTSLPAWIVMEHKTLYDLVQRVFEAVDESCEWIRKVTGIKSDNAILHFNEFLYEATRRYPEYQRRIDGYDEEIYRILEKHFRAGQELGLLQANLDPRLLAIELYALQQQMIYLRFVNPTLKKDPSILRDLARHFYEKIEVKHVR